MGIYYAMKGVREKSIPKLFLMILNLSSLLLPFYLFIYICPLSFALCSVIADDSLNT